MSIRRFFAGGVSLALILLLSGCRSTGDSSTSSGGGLFSRMSESRPRLLGSSAPDCHCSSGVPTGIMTSGPTMNRDIPFPGVPIMGGPNGTGNPGFPPAPNVLPGPIPVPRPGISESGEAPRREDPGMPKMSVPKIVSPK